MVQLQRALSRFRKQGLNVAGVTYDNAAILQDFAKRQGIEYSLLSDPNSAMIRAFGIVDPDESPNNLPEFAKKGMALAGYFFVSRDGVVKEKYFGNIYYDRYTPNNIIAKLFPELIEKNGEQISGAHLQLLTTQSDEDVIVGNRVTLGVTITLPRGMHVYAPQVKNYKPVQLIVDSFDETTINPKLLKESRYPRPRSLLLPAIKERVPVYENRFQIMQDLLFVPPPGVQQKLRGLGATSSAGVSVNVLGRLRYQACDVSVCYPPAEVKLTWQLRLHAADQTRSPEAIRDRP